MVDQKRARLKDVALQAGVSMMTVSRVLNQDDKVSAKTQEKVMSIADSMGYKPNVSARRLASNKSFFIGLLYDNPSQAYISQFLLSALQSCRTKGYHLIVEKADNDIEQTLASIKQLINETQMDGMVLLPPVCDSKPILSYLKQVNMPLVRISPDNDLTLSSYICMDDYQAAFDVTQQLITTGHTKIAHIIGDLNQGVSRLRYQGFLDALRSNQITVPPEYIINGSFTYQSGMEATSVLLSLAERPTAIFAANDDMAAAAISVVQSQGLNVPQDVAVVGFDDTQVATIVWPNITTVKQPIDEMAQVAINILTADEFHDGTHGKTRHVLDFEIVQRGSCLAK